MTFGTGGGSGSGDSGESPDQGGDSGGGSTPDGGESVPGGAGGGGPAIVDGAEADDKSWHLGWNGDPDTGGCPHCPKNQAHERHRAGCPVRRKRRHKRRDRINLLKRLLGLR